MSIKSDVLRKIMRRRRCEDEDVGVGVCVAFAVLHLTLEAVVLTLLGICMGR